VGARNNTEYPPVDAIEVTRDEVIEDIAAVRKALLMISQVVGVLPVF